MLIQVQPYAAELWLWKCVIVASAATIIIGRAIEVTEVIELDEEVALVACLLRLVAYRARDLFQGIDIVDVLLVKWQHASDSAIGQPEIPVFS